MFEELPPADFGNRIPNITAEIARRRAERRSHQILDLITPEEGGGLTDVQRDELAVDWRRGCGYFLADDGDPALAGLRRFSLQTMREERQARMADIAAATPGNFPGRLFCGEDSYLYLVAGSSNTRPILRIDPDSLREVARFGAPSTGLSNTAARFVATDRMGMVSAYGPAGRVDFLLTGSVFDDVGLLRTDGMSYVWGAGRTVEEPRIHGVVGGRIDEGAGEGWVLAAGSPLTASDIGVYRIVVAATATYTPELDASSGVEWTKVAVIAPSDIEPGAAAFYDAAGGLIHDPADDSLIFQTQVSHAGEAGTVYTVKWRIDGGVVWKTPTPIRINYDGAFFSRSRLQGQRWTLMRNQRIVQLDTATGAIVYDQTWDLPFGEQGAQTYDALTDSLIAYTSAGWVRLSLGRGAGQAAALGDIVADLCRRVGLAAYDIDVTALTDSVAGYVVSRQTPARSALEPLAGAFFFDGVESDDVLAFRKRGAAPVAALTQADLIAADAETGAVWRERRTQEVELPARVSVVYIAGDADYQQGTPGAMTGAPDFQAPGLNRPGNISSGDPIQMTDGNRPSSSELRPDKRAAAPLPTMASANEVSLDLPVVLNAATAKGVARKALYNAWIERASYETSISWRRLRLDPADVIDVTLADGAVHRARLTRATLGADLTLKLDAVAQEAAAYAATAVADPGSGLPPQIVAAIAATRLFLFDLPLLRDIDDVGGRGSRLYYAMAGYGPVGWPGAALYRSADGGAWKQVGAGLGEAAWGATVNALGAPRSPFCTDDDNKLTVFMTVGGDNLESVTQEALVNGANAAVVLKGNGEPEIIQFRDIVFNPDGSYTLSGLLRGRRGTDAFVAGHAAGELFLLLDPDDVEALTLDADEIGVSRAWRAAGFGTLFEDAPVVTAIHTGRDLKPYAPWDVRAARAGSPADITLSWVRRTRLAGHLRDGAGEVPLGEASEAYEVDILAAPGGAVKRTLATSTPSATYANADIISDFAAVPATLSVIVHQLGAFGRGFPRAVTLEIT